MSRLIADLQPSDRPRERLLDNGVDVLSERELLALVLRNGRKGENVLDLASALLSEFGGLRALSIALPEELTRFDGVGPAKAGAAVAAFRIGRMASGANPAPVRLKGSADLVAAVRPHLDGARRERLVVLICDGAAQLIRVERITEGSIDRAMVPVREILNAVLRHDGRSFALAHNHPSGGPAPSEKDRVATDAAVAGAKIVGLRFLDHVVLGRRDWRSVKGCR